MAKAFIVPFVLYLLGTSFAARFSDAQYPFAYAMVVVLVAVACIWLSRGQQLLRPHWKVATGVAVGVLGIVLWIALSELQIERSLAAHLPTWLQPGERVGYNPFEKLNGNFAIGFFITVRLIGLAIIVPVAEELFWRGFLLRWTIDPEWEKVPIGEYTLSSCMIVTALFTLAHPEWLAAAVYCLLLNGLLYWKRDLWQCVIAHAVSNFLLAIYVLWAKAWWLW